MPGIVNERGWGPLLEDGPRAVPVAGARADAVPSPARRVGFGRVLALLDGIGGLGWSVIGFVAGAVFWHFVGFWGFVADVILAGGPPAAESTPPALVRIAEEAHLLRVADASACTLLALDRRTGLTTAAPCEASHGPLPPDAVQGREDRLAAGAAPREGAAPKP